MIEFEQRGAVDVNPDVFRTNGSAMSMRFKLVREGLVGASAAVVGRVHFVESPSSSSAGEGVAGIAERTARAPVLP